MVETKISVDSLMDKIGETITAKIEEIKADNEKFKLEIKDEIKKEADTTNREASMPIYEEYTQTKEKDYKEVMINYLPKQYSDQALRDGTPEVRFKAMLKGMRTHDEKLVLSAHGLGPGPVNTKGEVIRPWDMRERLAIMNEVEKDLTSNNSAGLIPVDYMRVLINCLYFDPYKLTSKWRNRFTQLPDTRTPTLTSGSTVYWVGEAETKPESDPTFGEYTWEAKKQIVRTDVTEEMLEDSDPSVAEEIRKEHVRAMELDSILMFFYGDGVNNPRGIDLDIPAANTIFVGAVFNGDDFHRLKCAVRNDYRQDAWFYANDCIFCIAERFKDTNGQYLWKQGMNDMLTDKTPETMIGYPYYRGVDDTMPIASAETGTGTGAYGHIFYGNPYNYMTQIRTQWRIKYNPEFSWTSNIDSFITEARWDGRMLCNSFSKLEGVRCTLTGV